MNNQLTGITLDLMRQGLRGNDLAKAITQATGLINIDLQPVAKLLYPVITPLRNLIPRKQGNGGTATQWRAITAINTGNIRPWVSEGNRNSDIAINAVSYIASYKGLGHENFVTFEADMAAVGFDDMKARGVESTLRALMISEERGILWGNTTKTLGTTPTPTVATSTSGGTIATGTVVSVICVALTHEGFKYNTVTGGLTASITRTNLDGSSDTFGGGVAQKSVAANVTTGAGSANSVTAIVASAANGVQGAAAYAWYWGTTGNETLGAITTINSVLITVATGTGTQLASALPSADNSTNALAFDGLIYLALGAGQQNPAVSASGALVAANATGVAGTGSPLTSDSAGGILEINADLKSFYDTSRLGPSHIFVSSQEIDNITKKVIASGAAPLFRFVLDGDDANQGMNLNAGARIRNYLNRFMGTMITIQVHPDVPPGTILYYTQTVPYPLSNITNLAQIEYRRDYYQIDWPLVRRRQEYGVYMDGVLMHFFPQAMGVRYNIANG